MSEFLEAAKERMIERARERGLLGDDWPELIRASPEAMQEFNRRFFHIRNFGNRSRIGEMKVRYYGKDNERKDHYLSTRSLPEFLNAYRGDKITVSVNEKGVPIKKTKAEVWLEYSHPTVEEVVFRPNEETPADVFNLWRGFAFEPKKGDGEKASDGCALYLAHLKENICNDNPSKYKVLLSWMGWAVRHPEKQATWAITCSGSKGVGKNVAFEPFVDLFGEHGIVVAGEHALANHFNAHLMNKIAVLADEAFFAKDPRADRLIKTLITGKSLTIEPKGIDAFTVPSFLHSIIIGNDKQLVNATIDDRRYFVLECGSRHRQDQFYFEAILDQLRRGGYEALLYHLLHDVTLLKLNDAPRTEKMNEIISVPPVEEMWQECLTSGDLPGRVNNDGTVDLRIENLLKWAHNQRRRGWDSIGHVDVTNLLGRKGFDLAASKPVSHGGKDIRCWHIPELSKCRDTWDAKRMKRDWPDGAGGWENVHGLTWF